MVRSDSADEERMMGEKIEVDDEDYDDIGGDDGGMRDGNGHNGTSSRGGSSVSPTGGPQSAVTETDRRMRRQIANCNERRRMQSINAGFQSLRALLPRKEGEKLSKAAILQQTAELIQSLRAERARLLDRGGLKAEDASEVCGSPQPNSVWKKPRLERESDDSLPSSSTHNLDPAIIEQLRSALERERGLRVLYEHRLAQLANESGMGAGSASSAPPSTPLSPVAAASAIHHPMAAMAADAAAAAAAVSNGVIRPTPTQPLRVDISLANLVSLSAATPVLATPPPTSAAAAAAAADGRSPLQPPSPGLVATMAGLAPAAGASPATSNPPQALAHRSLHAILEAIRHLEGNAAFASASPPPATSHANLLVR